MPSAQEIRTYLEKNGIQAALTAAVNEAIQARAQNPLDFIGDSLKAKAAAAAAAGGDEGNAEGNPGSGSLESPVSLEANTGPAESPVSLDPPPAAEENADEPASTAASPEPDDFFKVSISPPTPLPHPIPPCNAPHPPAPRWSIGSRRSTPITAAPSTSNRATTPRSQGPSATPSTSACARASTTRTRAWAATP